MNSNKDSPLPPSHQHLQLSKSNSLSHSQSDNTSHIIVMNDCEIGPRNSLDNGSRVSFDTVDTSRTFTPTESQNSETILDADRLAKPSRIPILRGKNLEGSSSDNDSIDKPAYTSFDDYDRSKQIAPANIPTSPITGKKYRSPLSLQPRLSDRSIKRQTHNGNVSCDENNALNSPNGSTDAYNSSITKTVGNEFRDEEAKQSHGKVLSLLPYVIKNSVKVQNYSDSEWITPVTTSVETLADKYAIDINEFDINMSNSTNDSERKPRYKWMFGQHKNVNVVCHWMIRMTLDRTFLDFF